VTSLAGIYPAVDPLLDVANPDPLYAQITTTPRPGEVDPAAQQGAQDIIASWHRELPEDRSWSTGASHPALPVQKSYVAKQLRLEGSTVCWRLDRGFTRSQT